MAQRVFARSIELFRGVQTHRLRRQDQFRTTGYGRHLRLAGALEIINILERLGDGAPRHQQPVVGQYHRAMLAKVGHEAITLVVVQRDAFIAVIGKMAVEFQRVLTDRQQPLLLG